MSKKKTEKLKNPTGLSLKRTEQYKWTLTWNRGNNYTKEQVRVTLRYDGMNWKTPIEDIEEHKTSYSYKIDYKLFAPYENGRVLEKVTIAVRGKFGGKWSDWKEKTIDYEPPRAGKGDLDYLTVNYELLQRNKGVFTWEYSDEKRPVTRIQYQSKLVLDCPDNITSETLWTNCDYEDTTNALSGSLEIAESSGLIANESYTRIFRARPCSFAGMSNKEWVYASHVYAAPNAAENVRGHVTLNKDANTLSLAMNWITQSDKRHPIDEIVPQYRIDIPEAGMTCPDDDNWISRPTMADTDGLESDVFSIDGTIGQDKCVFVRVVTKHDGDNEVTHSIPVMATGDSRGTLKAPTITSITAGDNAVTILATNNSEVEDSYLLMYYEDKDGNLVSLGRQSQSNIYPIPNLQSKLPIIAGAKAVVGDFIMQSDMAYSAGDVPIAPNNLRLDQSTTVRNTVVAEWDWNWDSADACEISWSEHEDAWRSTDEPDTHIITKANASMLNISDVTAGIPLYVRARFIKGTEDDGIYSPYSDIETITISSEPNRPTLMLNKDIFLKGEQIVASWTYESTDGTEQVQAIVGEYVNNDYEPLVKVHTEQSVTLENNFSAGTQHDLAVMVCSGSGRWSKWSPLYTITVAEELTCEISEHSLVWEDYEQNPETHEGNPATYDGGTENELKTIASLQVEMTPKQDGTPWQDTNIDKAPYLLRKTPTNSHSLNSEYNTLVGGTVAWNQVWRNGGTTTANGITFTIDSEGYITITGTATNTAYYNYNSATLSEHVYYVTTNASGDKSNNIFIYNDGHGVTTQNKNAVIGRSNATNYLYLRVNNGTVIDDSYITRPQAFDLTKMLGSAIADYVYSLETTTAGAGVSWLKQYGFIDDKYHPYNAGNLLSVHPSAHKMVGFNLWDEEWEAGMIDANGQPVSNAYRIRSKNYIIVVGGASYYVKQPSSAITVHAYDYDKNYIGTVTNTNNVFTMPSNCGYIKFNIGSTSNPQTTYNHDICINFSKTTGSPKNGDYVPYSANSYTLPGADLRGIFKLNNGVPYCDGDTDDGSGTRVRKYGIVDMGTKSWAKATGSNWNCFYASISGKALGGTNIICSKYNVAPIFQTQNDKCIYGNSENTNIYIRDSNYAELDGPAFKEAMSGVYLVYELATSTTETSTAFTNPQVVDPDGTEQYIDERTVSVPVGHETRYADIYPITGVDTVDTHIKGINVWDEEWELGLINRTTGEPESANNRIRSKNYINVLSDTDYYLSASTNIFIVFYDSDKNYISAPSGFYNAVFHSPANAEYMKFYTATGTTTYNNDISINCPSTDHGYHAYAGGDFTTDLGRTVYGGVLDLKSGKLTVDKVQVDMGSLNWTKGNYAFYVKLTNPKSTIYEYMQERYNVDAFGTIGGEMHDKSVAGQYTGQIYIRDTSFTDATKFKQSLVGAKLIYEVATPQEYNLTPQQVEAVVGRNYVWSEQGNIRVRVADAIESGWVLDKLPLTVKVTGGGTKLLSIKRDEPYIIERPDGEDFRGYMDEDIFKKSYSGTDTQTIDAPNIEGARLDDGAHYRIEASATDEWKQSAEAESIPFIVKWDKQAVFCDGNVTIDDDIALIEIVSGYGSHEDDYVDVFRMSTDKPQLIYTGAHYGDIIVDPYPTIGENGGYLLVCNTVYGDSITEDDRLAWTELDAPFESKKDIIDFDGERIYLFYNVDTSFSWDKDSKVTKYLGGKVVVDHKKGVMRNGTISAVAITLTDNDMILAMRRLLEYQDNCHIRTRDGSSFTADIQGSDESPHDKGGLVRTFSLSVTKCDNRELDGMTWEEWLDELD